MINKNFEEIGGGELPHPILYMKKEKAYLFFVDEDSAEKKLQEKILRKIKKEYYLLKKHTKVIVSELILKNVNNKLSSKKQAALYVLADLVSHGWTIKEITKDRFVLSTPPKSRKTIDEKKSIRKSLLAARDKDLRKETIQRFIFDMEQPTKNLRESTKNTSIKDIIHDGNHLASNLQDCLDKKENIIKLINPKIYFFENNERDAVTGIKLKDIWRYFRLTWSLEYQNTPGRRLPFIVRNESFPNKPIMGIGMLASPVLLYNLREDWIGWSPRMFLKKITDREISTSDFWDYLVTTLEYALEQTKYDDLKLKKKTLLNPSIQDITKLTFVENIYQKERQNLLKNPDLLKQYRAKIELDKISTRKLNQHSESSLYKIKRIKRLAKILSIRKKMNDLIKQENNSKNDCVRELFSPKGEYTDILRFLIGEVRITGTASNVLDLNVCGAIPPYNNLLAGKLVALLTASKEIQKEYSKRYANTASEISSFMKGEKVYRNTDIEIVTTTSLYGKHSSQYNRLKLHKKNFPYLKNDLIWEKIGITQGKGILHYSSQATEKIKLFTKEEKGYTHVNSVFGEGTSPKLRKIRDALSDLGFYASGNEDIFVNHNQPRLFLALETTEGAKQRLMKNFNKKDKNHSLTKKSSVKDISRAWLERWVEERIKNTEIIEKINKFSYKSIYKSLETKKFSRKSFMNKK